jgi:hypothetical protein
MATPDEICPSIVGEPLIRLSVDPRAPARAHYPIDILVDYSACEPAGVSLPLEMLVTIDPGDGPSRHAFRRKIFRRIAPGQLTVTPAEGGRMHVTFREVFHNRWWGELVVEVAGEALDPEQ